MSSELGSSTITGWKRRSSAASFSMCLRYSSSVVAPTARSSPRASIGLSRFEASTAPSAPPAPTIVCSSSMNRMIVPSASAISLRTALSRSSNSPRYFEPAISAPMSSAMTRRSRSDSGTSPETMRWARPSTIAVLPTPGSPMSTGLFLVRRERTWITRRISSSRPMTGSSLPSSAALGQVAAELVQRLELVLGVLVGHAVRAAHLGDGLEQLVARRPGAAQGVARARLGARQREQQVLGGDVLVLELAGGLLGAAEDLHDLAGGADVLGALAGDSGKAVEGLVDLAADLRRGRAELLQHRHDDAAVLLEEDGEKMFGGDLRVAAVVGEALRGLDGLLRLDGEAVCVHAAVLSVKWARCLALRKS